MRHRSDDRRPFADYAAKLAAEMGMTLELSEYGYGARLHGAAGTGYWVSEPYNSAGRVEIRGSFPRTELSLREDRKMITVAMSRGAGAAAREIRRRLEPGYREALARVAAYNAEFEERASARDQIAGRMESLFSPGAASRIAHRQSSSHTAVHIRGEHLAGGEVQLSYAGAEATFRDFRVPAEVAIEMLEVYARSQAGRS